MVSRPACGALLRPPGKRPASGAANRRKTKEPPLLDCLPAPTDDARIRSQEMPVLKLSAFSDEISPEPDEQIRVCREVGVTHVELRHVRGVNVLDFDPALRAEVKSKLRDAGMGVICIGSPIWNV